MKLRKRARRPVRIEMLPLIDIVFLLLIFFIYAMLSMAVHRGLDLDLPESAVAAPTKEALLSISVRQGESGLLVYIDDKQVELTQVRTELSAEKQGEAVQQVLIFAEENISYQELFMVLDQVQLAGIEQISLQANKE